MATGELQLDRLQGLPGRPDVTWMAWTATWGLPTDLEDNEAPVQAHLTWRQTTSLPPEGVQSMVDRLNAAAHRCWAAG